MNVNPGDSERGIYGKFVVRRVDGDPTGKHSGCDYFVLDLVHDPHARAALAAYAQSCAGDYPALASDLLKRIATAEPWRDLPAEADPISTAVDDQLQPLAQEMKEIGHRLAKEK